VTREIAIARALALAIPATLMAGALGSQYWGGLYPCEMCLWQRWPHYAAIALALLAFVVKGEVAQRMLVLMAAFAIAVSGAIGVFHAGVEYGFWEGVTQCATTAVNTGDMIADIMKAPLVRCDVAPWSLFGISLAGYNAIISLAGALIILRLLQRKVA
jgi:disulfide bond formation protein DsbB